MLVKPPFARYAFMVDGPLICFIKGSTLIPCYEISTVQVESTLQTAMKANIQIGADLVVIQNLVPTLSLI